MKKPVALTTLIIGFLVLIAGVTALVIKSFEQAKSEDAIVLVEERVWIKDREPDVIWTFSEIGKGTLTTNHHQNDYDFIWALDGDTIKIETKWLKDVNNTYKYHISSSHGVTLLTLTKDDGTEILFVSAKSTDTLD